jgi:hypothetical protein
MLRSVRVVIKASCTPPYCTFPSYAFEILLAIHLTPNRRTVAEGRLIRSKSHCELVGLRLRSDD